ncbi:MAG: hypothetical protein IT345_11765 [Trueperaceae bacterium]|nr:hypothetical protein [Trueperaceae bacterium]
MRTRFEFALPLAKAYKDGQGRMHVVGVASDTLPDFHDDRMSDRAIAQMARQATEGALPLLDHHRATFGFGKTIAGRSAAQGKARELVIDFELDAKYPQALDLFHEVLAGKAQKQLSIGGVLNLENPKAVRFEEDKKTGRVIRVIEDIVLEHIAATRPKQAANERTGFIQAVVKDLLDEPVEPKENAMKDEERPEQDGGAPDTTPAPEAANTPAPQTPSETAGEAPAPNTPESEPAERDGDDPAADPADDAEKGLSFLARLGTLLRSQARPAPDTVEQESPAAVQALAAAFERVRGEPLTEKARFDLRRILTLMQRYLDDADPPDTEAADTPESGEPEKSAPAPEAVLKDLAAGVRGAVEDVLLKGLGALADELRAIRSEQARAAEQLGARVARMEKVAGVRQSADGQEDPARAAVRPSSDNPFAGIFGHAITQARRVMGPERR